MKTEILPINSSSLSRAKDIIGSGSVLAFPTETVYGLGANAFDDDAVKRIFEIKGRPNDNPLIVHVHKDYDLGTLVSYIPDYAVKLSQVFLPGPLTMVYKSENTVSSFVSCGLNTLAVRVPAHEGAQELLKYLNLPIAAPSANLSKHVSPVTAQHVYDDLNGKIELILDGGKCSGGIESTVLDCTGGVPCILRSGLVTREMITEVVGDCRVYVMKEGEKVLSPGLKYKHYSPKCKTALYNYPDRIKAFEFYNELNADGVKAYIMCDDKTAKELNACHVLNLGKTEEDIAANLYGKLREGETKADFIIAIEPEKQDGLMTGVLNRMRKACG